MSDLLKRRKESRRSTKQGTDTKGTASLSKEAEGQSEPGTEGVIRGSYSKRSDIIKPSITARTRELLQDPLILRGDSHQEPHRRTWKMSLVINVERKATSPTTALKVSLCAGSVANQGILPRTVEFPKLKSR